MPGQRQANHQAGRAIRLIGDAWILLILINLLRGRKRFNELRESMGHISSKTLIQRLRALEEMGFVQRRACLEIPPRVEYHLTEKGQEFGDVIAAIEQFAQNNLSGPVEAVTTAEPRHMDCFRPNSLPSASVHTSAALLNPFFLLEKRFSELAGNRARRRILAVSL
jgi:DNA-binding HxlR family transcriptional regulator